MITIVRDKWLVFGTRHCSSRIDTEAAVYENSLTKEVVGISDKAVQLKDSSLALSFCA